MCKALQRVCSVNITSLFHTRSHAIVMDTLQYVNCKVLYVYTLVNTYSSLHYAINSTAPRPRVAISTTGTLTAGRLFSFICTVTLEDGGSLTEDLTVQWVTPVGININTDSDIGILITNSIVAHNSTLKFTPLRTSHGGQYTCNATTTAGNDTATETLTLKSEKGLQICVNKTICVCTYDKGYSHLHSPSTHTGYYS